MTYLTHGFPRILFFNERFKGETNEKEREKTQIVLWALGFLKNPGASRLFILKVWPDPPASSFSLISTSLCPWPPPVPPAPLGLRSWHPRERGSPWMWHARLGQEPEGCPGAHLMGFWRDPVLSAAAGGRVRGRLFRSLISSCTTLSIFLRLGSCHNYNVLFISFQTLLFCGNNSEPIGAYWGCHDELSRLDVFMGSVDLPRELYEDC